MAEVVKALAGVDAPCWIAESQQLEDQGERDGFGDRPWFIGEDNRSTLEAAVAIRQARLIREEAERTAAEADPDSPHSQSYPARLARVQRQFRQLRATRLNP